MSDPNRLATPGTLAQGSALVDERVPYERRVFCNRNLRMDKISYIGFDMDYTLARYKVAMEQLQADMVLERLVSEWGYDPAILGVTRYDPAFAIRGLTVDIEHGNILKMDAHRFVGRTWHGAGPLDPETRRQQYTNFKVSPSDDRFVMVDTLFSLPEISLYCQLVAHFDGLPEGARRPAYSKLWWDLRNAMDSLHRDDSLKVVIRADLGRYIYPDPELAETLHRFRSAGKKLFVLTNSEPEYTEALMGYLLEGAHPGYASWHDYFDFVIASSRKPSFFTGDEPFLTVDEDLQVTDVPATRLRRGQMVVGGSFVELARLTGMLGEEVLYIGDHIYGDILRSKIHTHWRTAMVVQEMETELSIMGAHRGAIAKLEALLHQRFQLSLERAARALDGDRATTLKGEVRSMGREIGQLEAEIAEAFNPAWGMVFRDRAELSAFGAQVERYACIYTSRVSNFRLYSPQWYYRSPRDRMAHELHL